MIFGIPSYRRAYRQTTLALLADLGVPKKDIIVCTQTQEDYEVYKEAGVGDSAELACIPASCVAEARNNLLTFIDDGKEMVMLDDDIADIERLDGDILVPVRDAEELHGIVADGFSHARRMKTIAFTCVINANARVRPCVSRLGMSGGAFIGLIKGPDVRFSADRPLEEVTYFYSDVLRKYKALPRLDWLHVWAGVCQPGGCEEERERFLLAAKHRRCGA